MYKTLSILLLCLLVLSTNASSTECSQQGATATTTLESSRSLEFKQLELENLGGLLKIIGFIFKTLGWTEENVHQEQQTCDACEEKKNMELKGVHYYCQVTCANVDPTISCPKQNGRQILLNFEGLFKPTPQLTQAFEACQKDSDAKVNVDNCVCLFLLNDNRIPDSEASQLKTAVSEQCGCDGKPVPFAKTVVKKAANSKRSVPTSKPTSPAPASKPTATTPKKVAKVAKVAKSSRKGRKGGKNSLDANSLELQAETSALEQESFL